MMTVKELRDMLSQFPENEPVWVYEPSDANEPYQPIKALERGPAGDLTIYRE